MWACANHAVMGWVLSPAKAEGRKNRQNGKTMCSLKSWLRQRAPGILAFGKLRQEDCPEFKANLGNYCVSHSDWATPYLKETKKIIITPKNLLLGIPSLSLHPPSQQYHSGYWVKPLTFCRWWTFQSQIIATTTAKFGLKTILSICCTGITWWGPRDIQG